MRKPAKLPPLAKVITNKQILEAARPYLTTDKTRHVLLNYHCEPGHTVATDGRRIIDIEMSLCPRRKNPSAWDKNGREVDHHGNYPNWRMVMPTQFRYKDTINVEWLHGILMKMSQDGMFAPNENHAVKVCLNEQGHFGIKGNPITTFNRELAREETLDGKPVFSYGWSENRKLICAYNGHYLIQALRAARLLGDEMVAFNFIDDISPMQISGKIHRTVIMPYRINS